MTSDLQHRFGAPAAFDTVRDWLWLERTAGAGSPCRRATGTCWLRPGARCQVRQGLPKERDAPADVARCSVRTVGNSRCAGSGSMASFYWQRRVRRVAAGVRVIVRQSSNAYRFTLGRWSKRRSPRMNVGTSGNNSR